MYRNNLFEAANKPIDSVQYDRLSEAFRYYPDDSTIMGQEEIANKIVRAIAKKAGISSGASTVDIPYTYIRDGIAMAGYLAFFDDGKAIRISFVMKGNSQRVSSIEFYDSPGPLDTPDKVIMLNDPNVNVVSIVELAANVLNGSVDVNIDDGIAELALEKKKSKPLIEGRKEEMVEYLTQAGPNASYNDYIKWAVGKGIDPGSNTAFYTAKQRFVAMAGAGKSGGRVGGAVGLAVTDAPPEEPLYDPKDADVFEASMEQDAVRKFEFYESTLRDMANADPEMWALFVYGNPGLGKSFMVKHIFFKEERKALAENNLTVIIKSGAISGFTGLLQVLYNHRKDHILILDDNDNLLVKNVAAANILKAALQTEAEERHITYSKVDLSALNAPDEDEEEGEFEDDGEDIDELEEALKNSDGPLHIYERNGKYLYEAASTKTKVDPNLHMVMGTAKDTIKDFYFQSRMIFISNLMEVPPAVGDRCIKIPMKFTPEQVLELVKKNMKALKINTKSGPLPDSVKMDVYNFMRRSRAEIERRLGKQMMLTYRMFRNCCIVYNNALQRKLGVTVAKMWIVGQLEADL